MNTRLVELSLDCVDFDDRRFRLGVGRPSGDLVESAGRAGILEPPLVASGGDDSSKRIIVFGWRRLLAAREAGLGEVRCLEFSSDVAWVDLLRLAVERLRAGGRLTKLAQGRAYRAWRALAGEDAEESEFLGLLGLPPKRGLGRAIVRWSRIPSDVEEALDSEVVSEAVALLLAPLDGETRGAFLGLFADLRLGVNRQKEALEWVPEIARTEESSPVETIDSVLREAREGVGESSDLPRVTETFRRLLRVRRFPRLSAAQTRFSSIVEDLGLPGNCSIEAPRSLEGSQYRFGCLLRSPEEVAEALRDSADRIERSEALRRFIERGE